MGINTDTSMQYFIYLIYNTVNGKLYVGKTNNPVYRWWRHKYVAKHKIGTSQYRLIHKAMHKYGESSFIFKVVQILDDEDMAYDSETLWYDTLKNNGYFLYNEIRPSKGLPSGKSHPRFGFKYAPGTHPFYGKKHSEETKEKNRQAHLGKPGPKKGIPRDIKTKLKISQALVGKPRSKETKEKLSKSLSGENNPASKITMEIAQQIRGLYSTGEYTHKSLADKFSLKKSQVGNIVNNTCWKSQ